MLLDDVAESRIAEAVERGDLDGLPGQGRPLDLDDDRMIPETLRVAYRVLRNANCVPPELARHREIRELEDLLAAAVPDEELTDAARRRAEHRLAALRRRLGAARGEPGPAWDDSGYRRPLLARFSRD